MQPGSCLFVVSPQHVKTTVPGLPVGNPRRSHSMSRVGAVFSGISAKKQPLRQVYFRLSKLSQDTFDAIRHMLDIGHAVDALQLALGIVVTDQRRGLFVVDL